MLLVTGITGHSGKYFLKELIKNKYGGTIRCIVRKTSDVSMIDSSGLMIEKSVGDLKDSAFVENCMKGVNIILHIAGIHTTLDIIGSAIKKNITKIIVVHTTGTYSKFKSASYEYRNIESKIKKMAVGNETRIVVLRPTMIYGNLSDLNISKFIKMVDKLRIFPVINHGSGLIQPVNARDLGKAYYQVLSKPIEQLKSEYILSGENSITLCEAFKLMSKNLNKKTIFVSVPLEIGVLMARIAKLFTFGKVDYVEKVQRMGENRSFSHKDATVDFGYNPMSFEEGIKIEVDQYMLVKRG